MLLKADLGVLVQVPSPDHELRFQGHETLGVGLNLQVLGHAPQHRA